MSLIITNKKQTKSKDYSKNYNGKDWNTGFRNNNLFRARQCIDKGF